MIVINLFLKINTRKKVMKLNQKLELGNTYYMVRQQMISLPCPACNDSREVLIHFWGADYVIPCPVCAYSTIVQMQYFCQPFVVVGFFDENDPDSELVLDTECIEDVGYLIQHVGKSYYTALRLGDFVGTKEECERQAIDLTRYSALEAAREMNILKNKEEL